LPSHDLDALIGRCDGPVLEAAECYERFAELDLAYGPAMRAIERVHSGERLAVARLRLPDAAAGGTFALHPSMLDAAFQSTLGLFASDDTTTAVPYAVGEVRVIAPLPATAWAVTRFAAEGQSQGEQAFDIDVCDDDGRICVRLTGFRVRSLVGAAVTAEPDDDFLARLIEAAGDGSLSLAEFERSLA